MQVIHAPSLNAHHLPWFNVAAPLDLPDLKGKVTLLDFWTYCCINCIHIIPTLKRIEAKFADDLVVIGVHSPKFPGEKTTENLERAIHRYEIDHPIVHDREMTIWKNYTVRAWPTLIFIDPMGYIIGELAGEPDPDILETTIENLLVALRNKDLLDGGAGKLLRPRQDDAQATTLRFPGKIAYSPQDDAFAIADANHNQIVLADRQGAITHRIGRGNAGQKDGGLAEAEFFRPQGLAYHAGIVWVADTENHLLRKIDVAAGTVSTLCGTGAQGSYLTQTGPARQVAISSPWDVALDGNRLYFANAGTHQIGVCDIEQHMAGPFAGSGQEALLDGPLNEAGFAQTSGLSLGEGQLFLADSETSAIRAIDLAREGSVETYVGTGLFDYGDKDGMGREALLQHPLGVHVSGGKVYIADSYNHKIRVMDRATRQVSTVSASVDLVCDGDACTRLWEPAGVLEQDGRLYVSDTNNHRILEIDPASGKTRIFIG